MNEKPPFRLRTFGWVKNSPRHFTPGTKLQDTMLILNLSGTGHYRTSSGEITVEPSMVGLIPPEDPGVLFSDTDDPYHHAYCRFGGTYAQSLAEQIIRERGGRFFRPDMFQHLVRCVEYLDSVIRKELPLNMGEHDLILARLLVSLAGKNAEPQTSALTAHALMHYIETHMDQHLKLENMAAHFNMTKPSLCRAGKKLLGKTIIQTSNDLRITYACELLKTTTMNVSEVAYRVGFEDPFYFSKVFKASQGVSPKKWQLCSD